MGSSQVDPDFLSEGKKLKVWWETRDLPREVKTLNALEEEALSGLSTDANLHNLTVLDVAENLTCEIKCAKCLGVVRLIIKKIK